MAQRRPSGHPGLNRHGRIPGRPPNARRLAPGIRAAGRGRSVIATVPAARVALFADTFYEVNGAARTCREFESFAHRNQFPFLCVRWAGARNITAEAVELVRS